MIRRPEELKIGHLTFTVSYLTDDQWQLDENLDQDSSGLMEGVTTRIWIRICENQDEDVTREILVHEVLHAIFFANMLYSEKPKGDWEESVIRRTSPLLFDALKNNPDLYSYLSDV